MVILDLILPDLRLYSKILRPQLVKCLIRL